jgi:hypothetical protein
MILFPQEASKDMIGSANTRARPTVIGGETMAGCGRLDPGGSALKVTPVRSITTNPKPTSETASTSRSHPEVRL